MPHSVRLSRLRALALASSLSLAVSCYRYTPIEGGPSSVGRTVVLQLSERGAIELAPQLGAQLQSISGRIDGFRDEAYQVSVTQTTSRGGVETLWRGESASVSRAYVTAVGDRQLDKRRTWIVAVLGVLGVVVAGEAFGVDTGLDGLLGGGGRGTRH